MNIVSQAFLQLEHEWDRETDTHRQTDVIETITITAFVSGNK